MTRYWIAMRHFPAFQPREMHNQPTVRYIEYFPTEVSARRVLPPVSPVLQLRARRSPISRIVCPSPFSLLPSPFSLLPSPFSLLQTCYPRAQHDDGAE